MSTSIETLEAELLSLSLEERSRLLERLIVSLDADPEVEAAWDREAERRDAEIDSGAVRLIPGEEVFARLRASLR